MMIVRRLRETVGLTQAELAAEAGTSQAAVAAYESGAKLPSLRTLMRIAASVGLEIEMRVVPALTREERRSLVLHSHIAKVLLDSPGPTLSKAKANLERMRELHPGSHALLDDWARILELPLEEVVDALVDERPHFRELRHVTPFAGVLDAGQRTRAYAEFRLEEEKR